jgi:hypothetical protein
LFPEVKAELYPVSELISQQFEHNNEEGRIMKSVFAGKTGLSKLKVNVVVGN